MSRVDYDRAAGAYRAGRTLPADILESWRAAVQAAAPRGGRVLDLGAGTGQFLDPLASWLDAQVVGVEPSAGMRSQARAASLGAATVVAGRAEALPLAPRSVDVAWLSAMFHHIEHQDRAVDELRRVVRPGGRVLVRGYFRDTRRSGLYALFPGIDRAASRFPTTTGLVDAFERGGFASRSVEAVPEVWRFTLDDWRKRVRALHHVDSMLRPLTDDEVAAGIDAVERQVGHDCGPVVSETELTLVVLTG